ncbi:MULTISPECIES: DNA methyltransferase [unclassified Mesorhizobium]|uniref:Eco57I restriction-modification methylase domain-containing protein n=1 Tax=unclassified Mesorhizobium TaxID=325217 RepID=UPI00112A9A51|nr:MULTISPECIES: DNA methyltransferase [unclassified Mesorhizobium]TPK57424.1 SAM-dependent methyltransferase [Mesorhizobium sp. B2-5-1]TPM54074.1 SAM-dependent methyltransferase [Mesorhizobium sp. B2-1-9]TPM80447.1 SAM-dependent methyltransferase [Mesorhizobium sp. B2-1-4]TPN04856.1 SAM-dependent methyltransferase [Mesorhizobium sp. B2-1-2]UCI13152.1 Eco57I restriction-modification methylase domain-containing protein [Mesorhizobium sp. B2-1-1]
MDFNAGKARKLLEQFDFAKLFIEELGWDRHSADLSVPISGATYTLRAVAEKRGMVAWVCQAPTGQQIPDRAARKKIETQVAKTTLEHLIIFTDSKHAEQIWCWARREAGKPASVPEHFWYASSGNRGFLQKLEAIAFSLSEENTLTLVDVTARARAAFDVERVTKRFYDQFKAEHKAFLDFISGITELADKEWYASLMLNRLMFIYFMQRKGFLNAERDYLRDRLARCQKEKGQDKFYSFYRYFLLRLFHEGLGGKARNLELDKLLGRIPYLNGGLFEKHPIEERCPDIKIPDEAFTRIFAYFDRYQWHLDERPLRNDNEINPDVLGYIFEKYINQKQMGAYYTKEDITEYISKNTVIPFLFDAAKTKCKVAFENPGGPTIWDHLRDDPDRYIYTAVKHGAQQALPPAIAAGIEDVSARTQWNQKAPADFGLPTEIWREVVARRTRYAEVRAKLATGGVREINDLITLNLDIRQFAQDVIERCEGPDLLRAFWKAIEGVTVLDPTCGSGAFLFAALNILEPLYETCLDRMEAFVADLERSGEVHAPKKFEDFKATLTKVGAHPNARYFTLKSIILNNLFGVDIMEEAVEICKLRLFLKLAAQVDPDQKHENLGIEPLPDIDFNIRAGNTLVGYATLAELKKSLTSKLDFDDALGKIIKSAADLQQTFDAFRARQIQGDGTVPLDDKIALRMRLATLEGDVNRNLAIEAGVKISDVSSYRTWLKAHNPFHWFLEFYRIMESGGFDVIIGNPPYAEIPRDIDRPLLRRTFRSALERWSRDEDLYTLVVERSLKLLRSDSGQFGMILPLSVAFSTKRPFIELRKILSAEGTLATWSHFDRIPSALFGNEVRTRCSITLFSRASSSRPHRNATTALQRWNAESRDALFSVLRYAEFDVETLTRVPKIGSDVQAKTLAHLTSRQLPLGIELRDSISFPTLSSVAPKFPQPAVYVGGTAYNWFPAWRDIPETTDMNGKPSLPARTAGYRFRTHEEANIVFALLCSSLGYWWWSVASDGFNLKKWLLDCFPVSSTLFSPKYKAELAVLGAVLRTELRKNYVYKDNRGRIGNYFLPGCAAQIVAIDDAIERSGIGIVPGFFADIREHNAIFARSGLADDGSDDETDYE